jgi:hypothetical protein
MLLNAIFAGLRAWELRCLRWADLDFPRNELHVRHMPTGSARST